MTLEQIMNENELYPSLVEKLHKDFSLSKEYLPAVNDLACIREHLINKVTELISKDYERFLNSLYRIDVSESKVSEILRLKDRTTIPERFADLIIERQLLRIKTQMLYRSGKL
jgi:hypothetical protein